MNQFTPTEFIAVLNQTLEYAYPSVMIVGEVASFKINQGKWVFFDLKDDSCSVSCFMSAWSLRIPLEDGMKVVVRGTPKMTKWGKFSFTVDAIKPVGEGSLKKAFELLKKKLTSEGLFDPAKKRSISKDMTRLGVISSTQAAGYADFIKIINARWGGMKIQVAHVQVQGMDAPDQIIRAIKYFNERSEVEAIAILRGGGSADDLSCFNDEALVREVAGSRIPVITGIGHEVDESLCDLAADLRASTPSNAAELITKDRALEATRIRGSMDRIHQAITQEIERMMIDNSGKVKRVMRGVLDKYVNPALLKNEEKMNELYRRLMDETEKLYTGVLNQIKMLEVLNPEKVLSQGYAIISGKVSVDSIVDITMIDKTIKAQIKEVHERQS